MTQAVADELDNEAAEMAQVDEAENVASETLDTDEAETSAEDADEVVISIEGESPAEEDDRPEDSSAIRALRQANREKQKRIQELEREKKQTVIAAADPAIVIGTKPTLASSDYDEVKFESELEAWHSRKQASETKQRADQAKQEKANAEWQRQVANHDNLRRALKVKNADEIEQIARDGLSQIQQNLMVDALENSAMTMHALGRSPKKLKEVASIENPVKFVAAVTRLEMQLNVTPKKVSPLPEQVVRGNAAVTTSADATLERLRKEADKTGDRSKVVRYMRDQRARGK